MIPRTKKPNGLMALIDVMSLTAFVALAQSAFLTDDTSRHMELDVALPREAGQGPREQSGKAVDVTLHRDGRLRVNGQEMEPGDLPHKLTAGQSVRIVADRQASAESLLRLGHSLSEIGIRNAVYLIEGGDK